MQYANGLLTKERVFETAKSLMHEHGYKKTTYSMIASKADVPVGLVNYYYKKMELVERIYLDFFQKIDYRIMEQEGVPENTLQYHILFSRILMTQIFSDAQTRAFHLEINYNNLLPQAIHTLIRSRQVSIIESLQMKMTPQYYYWCATAEYGARRELIEQNKNIDVNSPEFLTLVNLLSTITLRIVGLDQNFIDENLQRANEFYEFMDCSDVRMF